MIEPTDVDWTGYRRLEPAQAKSLPVEAFVAECPNCLTIIRYFGQSSQLKAWNTVTKDYGWPCCEGRASPQPGAEGGRPHGRPHRVHEQAEGGDS